MKLVVLGSTGMLGQAVVSEAARRKIRTFEISRHSKEYPLDITSDELLERTIKRIHPDVIINAAALVNLDQCEQNRGLAYVTNARVASILSKISQDINAYVVHISTDHYYTGDKNRKHTELERVTLVNEYARTKYAGEAFALLYEHALVVRTNILGFRNNDNAPTFVEWIIRSLKNASPMILFSDYFTSGIHVVQLAGFLFDMIEKKPIGLLNIASRDVFSKKELIETLASQLGLSLKHTKVGSVYETLKTSRAESNGLDVTKAESLLGRRLPTFKQVVSSIISEYKERFI